MTQLLGVAVILIGIGVTIALALRTASDVPELLGDDTPIVPPVVSSSQGPDTLDEYDVDVEVIAAPAETQPTGAWEAAIQKQLDAIENRDPTNELVAVTTVHHRMVLFYKRRKVK